jgi:predicted lipoprotein with Yx(FWY)xxD motif
MGTWAMEPAHIPHIQSATGTRHRGSGLRKRGATGAATIAGIAAIGLLAACGSSSPSNSSNPAAGSTTTNAATAPASTPASATASAAAASSTTVLKTEHTSLGTVLANAQGMTVYWFAADHGTTSACSGACAAAWPPVVGMPKAAAGVTLTGTLGTITRSDGSKQATYNGHPLYTFKADSAPGQVNGNKVTGFGAAWYAITIGASSGASTAPTSGSTSTSSWS